MKTKKLKKRLNKLEASLNCLVHYLVEKPLEKEQQQLQQINKHVCYLDFCHTLETVWEFETPRNEWIGLYDFAKNFKNISIVQVESYIEMWAEELDYVFETKKIMVENENKQPVTKLHFRLTKD
jgi:hypothetical protein